MDTFWYDGGMKPQTPEELYEDKEDLADEGMLIIGDKGKILCDFRATNPRLIPKARHAAFAGSIVAILVDVGQEFGNDYENSVLTFLRWPESGRPVLVACNFTPVPRYNYRVGVPHGGRWREILNSDAEYYGGSGMGNQGAAQSQPMPYEDFHQSLSLTLPPLSLLVFKPE